MESGWRHLVNNFWKQPVASLAKFSSPLHRWFKTPVGKRMLRQEIALIDQCRREYKGKVMFQVSGAGKQLMGKASPKRLKSYLLLGMPSKKDQAVQDYPPVVTDLDALPFAEESVDFLVLHHVLEFSDDPHAVLREASRVLSPQGHMLIICFNPYSLFGLRKSMQLIVRKAIPWAHHGLSLGRISDWLKLMNCEPLNAAYGFYSFPIQSERLLKYTDPIDNFLSNQGCLGGGFYMLHASKQIGGWVGGLPAENPRGHLVKFPVTAATRNFKHQD